MEVDGMAPWITCFSLQRGGFPLLYSYNLLDPESGLSQPPSPAPPWLPKYSQLYCPPGARVQVSQG